MNILITSATLFEIEAFINHYNFTKKENNFYETQINNNSFFVLISGIGQVSTTYYLSKYLKTNNFDLVLNIGICGSFNTNLHLGSVLNIVEEQFADLGINDNGVFKTFFDENFISQNQFPFSDSKLKNNFLYKSIFQNIDLNPAKSITVNTASGEAQQIDCLKQKFNADIENMEGAAFFYVCLLENIPFLEIRSISNYVEPRNRKNWNMKLAIKNLNDKLVELIYFNLVN